MPRRAAGTIFPWRRERRPVERIRMRVLISIPTLNEEKTVGGVISGIPAEIEGVSVLDVLVIDDGSSDATAERAREAGASVIRHARNRGLGAAFRTALASARDGGYDALVTIDGDGQFDPAGISSLLAPLVDGSADLVTCSRFMPGTPRGSTPWIRRFGNGVVAAMVNALTGSRVHDATCGFRAYGPAALEWISSFSRFTYTQETLIDLAWKRMRIREVALPVRGVRQHGRSSISGNLVRYAFLSAGAIYSASHDHMPWRFYGLPGLAMTAAGLIAEALVFARWIDTGKVTPFKGVAIAGLFLVVIGLLLTIMASLAESSSHTRHLIEEQTAYRVRQTRSGQRDRA